MGHRANDVTDDVALACQPQVIAYLHQHRKVLSHPYTSPELLFRIKPCHNENDSDNEC